MVPAKGLFRAGASLVKGVAKALAHGVVVMPHPKELLSSVGQIADVSGDTALSLLFSAGQSNPDNCNVAG